MSYEVERNNRFARAETLLGEYFGRVDSGEVLTFDAWTSQHPEVAEELRELHSMCATLRSREGGAVPGSPEASGSRDGGAGFRGLNRFGDYEIDPAPLAEGGMGTILSIRDRALGRSLAMKVLRAPVSVADRRLTARFLDEARITSQLDHPGIVPVHEMGLDSAGRPYFTMKRVQGQTFERVLERVAAGEAEWTQARALGVLQRVCEAVAFAHRRGVIHRDLKPSNVMVGEFGEVFVMDWGLARVLDGDVAASGAGIQDARHGAGAAEDVDGKLSTQHGDVLGTPAYMAPEQAEGRHEDVGRHSDAYAIGAMLYQLLAGRPPYSDEDGLPPPGIVLSRVLAGPPEPLRRVARDAPAELIAICERAMQRDIARRYPDVSALSADLTAFLEDRVVRAYETGAWAEARKWVQRNRALAATIALAAMFLVSGVVASAIYAREAREQASLFETKRMEADQSAALARRNEQLAAKREAEATANERRATKVTEFMKNALTLSDPHQGGRREKSVGEAMDSALRELDSGVMRDEPETEAELQSTIATILVSNGRPADALRLAEAALDTRRRLHGDSHPSVVKSLVDVGHSLYALGRVPDALSYYHAGLDAAMHLSLADDADTALCMDNVGICLREVGQLEAGLALCEEALAMRRRLYGDSHKDIASSLTSVGVALGSVGKVEEELACYEAAAAMEECLKSGDDPAIAQALLNLARSLLSAGRLQQAGQLAERGLAIALRVFNHDDSAVAYALSTMGEVLIRLQRFDEGVEKLSDSLAMIRRLHGGDHPEIVFGLLTLGNGLTSAGRYNEALPHFEEAVAMQMRFVGSDPGALANCLRSVAGCLVNLGRQEDALQNFQSALELDRVTFAGDKVETADDLFGIGRCLIVLGRSLEARPLIEEAAGMNRRLAGRGGLPSARSLFLLGWCLQEAEQYDAAVSPLSESVELLDQLGEHYDPERLAALNRLGSCLRECGRTTDAIATLQTALELAKRLGGSEDMNTAVTANNLALALQDAAHHRQALAFFEESLRIRRNLAPGDDPSIARALGNLVSCLNDLGRLEEGLELATQSLAMYRRLHALDGDHPDVLDSLVATGLAMHDGGRGREAVDLLREALAMAHRLFPGNHPMTARCAGNLAAILFMSLDDPASALPIAEEALASLQGLYPNGHPNVASAACTLGNILVALDRRTEALPQFEFAVSMVNKLGLAETQLTWACIDGLARCLVALGRDKEALEPAERAAAAAARILPEGSTWRVNTERRLASLKQRLRKADAPGSTPTNQ